MASYINADKLMEKLVKKSAGTANQRYTEGFNDALMRFRSMVSSARKYDSIEIIHCSECVHSDKFTKWNGVEYLGCCRIYCDIHEVNPNHFCSYGERRDSDGG